MQFWKKTVEHAQCLICACMRLRKWTLNLSTTFDLFFHMPSLYLFEFNNGFRYSSSPLNLLCIKILLYMPIYHGYRIEVGLLPKILRHCSFVILTAHMMILPTLEPSWVWVDMKYPMLCFYSVYYFSDFRQHICFVSTIPHNNMTQ